MLMSNYVLITDSASDLPSEIAENLEVEILPMKYMVNDTPCVDKDFDMENFYNLLRGKALSLTSQTNVEEFSNYFSGYLEKGKDILYVGFPLSLSGMNNSAKIAARELSEKYPERKIIVIDSVSASIGQGLLVYYAALKKKKGATIDEVADFVNENKLKFCHWFTVDDLYFLKRGGRISQATAVVGSILNVKPLLSMNDEGKLYVFDKIRGKKKVLDLMSSKIGNLNSNYKKVFVGHADCLDDAKYVAEKISAENPSLDVTITHLGPIIGTHTGPGTVALAFVGNSR